MRKLDTGGIKIRKLQLAQLILSFSVAFLSLFSLPSDSAPSLLKRKRTSWVAMETEHQAPPLFDMPYLSPVLLHSGAPPPLSQTQMRKTATFLHKKIEIQRPSTHPLHPSLPSHRSTGSKCNGTKHAPYAPLTSWRMYPTRRLSGFFKGIMYRVWWIEVYGEQIEEERDFISGGACHRRATLPMAADVYVFRKPSYFFQLFLKRKGSVLIGRGWGNDWPEKK